MTDTRTIQGATDDTFIVECAWPGVSVAQVEQLEQRVRRTVRWMRRRRIRLLYLGSTFDLSEGAARFAFRAASPDAVAAASAQAGIPFQRITGVRRRSNEVHP
jgi:hypothetical protein